MFLVFLWLNTMSSNKLIPQSLFENTDLISLSSLGERFCSYRATDSAGHVIAGALIHLDNQDVAYRAHLEL